MDSLPNDAWRTLSTEACVETKVKGSRFIGRAFPLSSVESIEAKIHEIRKAEYNATHNTFAWIVGYGDAQAKRYSDDGEPSGTAGRPILQALEGQEITNALVVVTRYFGGTKLGTGGLARAYGSSAKDTVEAALPVVRFHKDLVSLTLSFPQYNLWMKRLAELDISPGETRFEEHITMELAIRKSLTKDAHDAYVELTRGQGQWTLLVP